MTTVQNTDFGRRYWRRLVNATTRSTLELDPGESAEALIWVTPTDEDGKVTGPTELQELPADFQNRYLKVVEPAAEKTSSRSPRERVESQPIVAPVTEAPVATEVPEVATAEAPADETQKEQ